MCNLIHVQSSERSVESGRGHHHDRRIPSLLSSQHCADATSADGAEQAAHNRDGHRLLGENVEPNTGTEEGKIRNSAGTFGAGNKAFLCIFTLSSTIIICTSPLSSLYITTFSFCSVQPEDRALFYHLLFDRTNHRGLRQRMQELLDRAEHTVLLTSSHHHNFLTSPEISDLPVQQQQLNGEGTKLFSSFYEKKRKASTTTLATGIISANGSGRTEANPSPIVSPSH